MAGPGPLSPFDRLNENLVARILSLVEDGEDLFRCLAVCRKWRALLATQVEVLYLHIESRKYCEAAIRLLKHMQGLRKLDLSLDISDHLAAVSIVLSAGPAVDELKICRNGDVLSPTTLRLLADLVALKRLNVFYTELEAPPLPSALPFRSLVELTLSDVTITDAALVGIVGLCPSLRCLSLRTISGLTSPTIASASLRAFHWGPPFYFSSELSFTLETPNLEVLRVADELGAISVLSHSLQTLEMWTKLGMRCEIKKPLDLSSLALRGAWSWEVISGLLKHTRHLESLKLEIEFKTSTPPGGSANNGRTASIPLSSIVRDWPHLKLLSLSDELLRHVRITESCKQSLKVLRLPGVEELHVALQMPRKEWYELVAALVKCGGSLRRVVIQAHQSESLVNRVLAMQRGRPSVHFEIQAPPIHAEEEEEEALDDED